MYTHACVAVHLPVSCKSLLRAIFCVLFVVTHVTPQALKDMCLDSKRYQFLQKLELTLDILGGTVEQVARTAEVLGAVHQVHTVHCLSLFTISKCCLFRFALAFLYFRNSQSLNREFYSKHYKVLRSFFFFIAMHLHVSVKG